MRKGIISGLAIMGLMVGCASNKQERLQREFSELPPAVQKTLNSRMPAAEIADIDKEHFHGQTVYEIKYKDGMNNPKIQIAEDGKIVKFDGRIVERSGAEKTRMAPDGTLIKEMRTR